MNFGLQKTIDMLRLAIASQPLPGVAAHSIMAPYRTLNTNRIDKKTKLLYKKAAVMMLLFPKNETVHFALIQRPNYDGVHGGQVSFPGGKLETNEVFIDAALRETEEEIGVYKQSISILGALTEVYIPPSNMYVAPFLGYCHCTPTFNLNTYEVSALISVPFYDLFDDKRVKTTVTTKVASMNLQNEKEVKIPYFDLENKVVWGATAVILSEVKQLMLPYVSGGV